MQASADKGARRDRITDPEQPDVSLAQIANMSVGLFGIQIVWGLQTANTSRIFQTLGANLNELPLLWIAAPITGMIVQPLVGYFSDRTAGWLGRRLPYFAAGAIASALGLVAMAQSTTLWSATLALWFLTAAVNVAMQPLRALMADQLPNQQRTTGFALQVTFIGLGAVLASSLPWMLRNWFHVVAAATPGSLSPAVRLAFATGALGLIVSAGWTVATTRETPRLRRPLVDMAIGHQTPSTALWHGFSWVVAGLSLALACAAFSELRREIYLLAVLAAGYGTAQVALGFLQRRGHAPKGLLEIVDDIVAMPPVLRRLAAVQFFTWFGLFAMWVYAVPAIAARDYGTLDTASAAYDASANWVGVLFGLYDAVAAVVALTLPRLIARIGLRSSHSWCLASGAIGMALLVVIDDPYWLWLPAMGIGCAWASILSAPYVIVAAAVPASKMGVYIGIHNIFLVLPQLVGAAVLGMVLDWLFGGGASGALVLAAGSLTIAAALSLRL